MVSAELLNELHQIILSEYDIDLKTETIDSIGNGLVGYFGTLAEINNLIINQNENE